MSKKAMKEIQYTGPTLSIELPFYSEGPAVDSRGQLYCTNLSGGQILKVNSDGNVEEWARSACPNGQIILANDEHLVCDSKLGTIRRYDPEGRLVGDRMDGFCAGRKIQVPNDLVEDKNGGIYFTDSVRYSGCVGYLGKSGEQYIVAEGLDYPNGLGLSPDGKYLYVAESYKNRILKISVDRKKPELNIFAALPEHASGRPVDNLPDGLKVDTHGNVWVAHYGMAAIQVFSASGVLVDTLETQIRLTSNLYLDGGRLLITGGSGEPGPGILKIISK